MGPEDPQISAGATTRRSFLDYLMGLVMATVATGTLYPVARYLWPTGSGGATTGPAKFPLEDFPEGTGKVVRYHGKPTVIIRRDKAVYALSAVCPHLGCLVKYDKLKNQLICPCHAASFDVRGNLLGGPSPSPLPTFSAKISGETIVVEG